jgi:signal transduction histidine kinase
VEAVREEERARVAREIHDVLGQALTVIKLDVSWIEKKPPTSARELRKRMRSIQRQVDDTIESARKIVSDLRPSVLDDLGVIPAIEWQLKEFHKRTGIRSRFESNIEEIDLLPEQAAAVFRVVQEALTNVVRHARAKSVLVDLTKENGQLTFTVSDDGTGIRNNNLANSTSLGIVGMRERIHRIGGDFRIRGVPGFGTRIEIVLTV